MACPKCTLHLLKPPHKRPRISSRPFSTTAPHNRLGAFTYPQQWSTGTYHYNKALAKTLPVASQRTDELLTTYATQKPRDLDPANPLYAQLTRQRIAAQRRDSDRVLIGKTTAKEYVDRVEVMAFVFDGAEATRAEKEAFLKKRKGVKEGGHGGERNKRGPAARRRSVAGGMGGGGAAAAGNPNAGGGPRRFGAAGGGGAARGGTVMRRLPGVGGGARSTPPRPGGHGGARRPQQ